MAFPDRRLQQSTAQQDLLTSLLRVLGYVPDQEAIRDAAADSDISLGTIMSGAQHGSAKIIKSYRTR